MKSENTIAKTLVPTPKRFDFKTNDLISRIEGEEHCVFSWEENDIVQHMRGGPWRAIHFQVMDVITTLLHEKIEKKLKDTDLFKRGLIRSGKNCDFDDFMMTKNKEMNLIDGEFNHPALQIHTKGFKLAEGLSWLQFNDEDFRKFFKNKDNHSARILKLLNETSTPEFKLTLAIHTFHESTSRDSRKSVYEMKEVIYDMPKFCRLFNFVYRDNPSKRKVNREYIIYFNTLLAQIFYNNVKAAHTRNIEIDLYKLDVISQLIYRKFFAAISFKGKPITLKLSKIRDRLNLYDHGHARLKKIVEASLNKLVEWKFIKDLDESPRSETMWTAIKVED